MFTFQKPARPVYRVFIHCSASDHPHHDNIATMREWHLQRGWSDVGYHIFIRKNGTIELGRPLDRTPAAQRGHNRATIAICLHGLVLSKFTAAQKKALINLCQEINNAYGGGITFHGHSEVAAKACPVIDYKELLKLDARGRLGVTQRDAIKLHTRNDLTELEVPEAGNQGIHRRVLRFGDKGLEVKILQSELKELDYHTGAIDGHFGPLTRAAVLAFQADNYLVTDGIAGPATWEAINEAAPRPMAEERKKESVFGLAEKGSRIASASIANTAAGAAVAGGGALQLLEQASGTVSRITSSFGSFGETVRALGPWIGVLVLAAGLYIAWRSWEAGRARVKDHQQGKTL